MELNDLVMRTIYRNMTAVGLESGEGAIEEVRPYDDWLEAVKEIMDNPADDFYVMMHTMYRSMIEYGQLCCPIE